MSNGTLFSYSSPKFSLASDRDFFGRDTAPGLHPTTPTNAGPGSRRLLERCQGWRLQLRKQPGAAGVRAVRDWQTGGANLVCIWNKSEVFLFFKKHSIVEQMWNDSKPGLGKEKTKQHKWIFETYRASPGLRKWPSQREASWPRAPGRSSRRCALYLPPPGTLCTVPWGCCKRRRTSSQAACPLQSTKTLKSTKSPRFLSTWPLAFPCSQTKPRVQTAVYKAGSREWSSTALVTCFPPTRTCRPPQENKRCIFHRGKLIPVQNYDPGLCFNAAGCPRTERQGSRKAGRELSLSLAPTASQLQAAEQELSRL